ncbi:MAG: molybdopterin adenylyltransferase [Verrucomicrobiota bacterium]
MKVGRVTLSDRAAQGVYEDRSGPEIDTLVKRAFPKESIELVTRLLPDDQSRIESALIELVKIECCDLVITTGGTGPSKRDHTPEATLSVITKELPGFGELVRMESYKKVPTSILSRSTAGIREQTLIINLPGNPKAIGECLPLLIPAIKECLKHLAGED